MVLSTKVGAMQNIGSQLWLKFEHDGPSSDVTYTLPIPRDHQVGTHSYDFLFLFDCEKKSLKSQEALHKYRLMLVIKYAYVFVWPLTRRMDKQAL